MPTIAPRLSASIGCALAVALLAAPVQGAAGTHLKANKAVTPMAPATPIKPRTPPAPKQLTITVDWDDAMSGKESGLWIGYLFARMDFIGRNGGRYTRVPGVVIPIFDEEVFARSEAAKVYRNLKKQNKAMESRYFNELEMVDNAGFMPEYVWQYLKRPEWAAIPNNLRAAEFERWSKKNLGEHHTPETRGRVVFKTS
jgi:hypothetical protein